MTAETVKLAVAEAKRFIEKAGKIKAGHLYFQTSKESAAARRASMDLTRALAEMRKPT